MESTAPPGLALGLAWYAVFLFQLVLHEASHSLAARLGGDDTASASGLVTLDPVPHIRRHPFGTVVVPIISYLLNGWVMGWGSAPYDAEWAERYPHREAKMALAGPLANLFLLLLSGTLIYLGLYVGWFEGPGSLMYKDLFSGIVKASPEIPKAVPVILSLTFTMNLIGLLLNILPLPPLDGSGAIMLLMPESAAARWQSFIKNPTLNILGMIAAWRIIGELFIPVFDRSLNIFYAPLSMSVLIALALCTMVPVAVFAGFFRYGRKKADSNNPYTYGTSVPKKYEGPSDLEIAGMQRDIAAGDFKEALSMIGRHPELAGIADRDGALPLHYAADSGQIDICRFLLDRGASTDSMDGRGATPLHYAASKGHSDAAELLLSAGADVNAKTEADHATPLHCAAVAGFVVTAALLISKGADPDARKKDGQTPLHRAVSKGHRDMVALLLSKGSKTDQADSESRTPLDLAGENDDREIIRLLTEKTADPESR
jgi:ankyrin repeat protein